MSAPALLLTGRYALDAPRSTVRFTARSLGFAVPGTLDVRHGEVLVDDTGATVTAVLDAASFRTRSERRDRDVRSARFLDADRFPDVSFTGRWDGPGTPVRGSLTVRDVAAPVELLGVTVDGATVRARARLDRRPHGVGPARGPIGRWVDVELEIALRPAVGG